ncbi:MAG: cadmium-translocating P-type ATPase [Ruminococcus sp.]|nr:cadmium-translocating P-type ATPase [Ruminococcus sp.]
MLKNYKYYIKNLDCANCAKKIEDKINKDERFSNVVVNFSLLTLNFSSDISNPLMEIKKIVKEIEPDVVIYEEKEDNNKKDFELFRLILAIVLLAITFIIKNNMIKDVLIVIVYILLLYKTFLKALKKIIKSHNIDENLLITISAIGAYLLGEHMEGIMVVMLYVIGKILEERAVNHSRLEIKNLLDLKINKANLMIDGKIKEVNAEELKVDDIIVVKKGETIPADGIIIKGNSLLDTSHLTGESVYEKVEKNDKVLSGSINIEDVLEIKVENNYYESTAYKIFELTINATNNKAKTETKVSKIASFYTPAVLLIAIFISIVFPLIFDITYSDSIYRALTFLVISCPCAIAISVPLSYFAGIGASSKAKVLVKGSNFLDILPKCKTIVFDKTGTLTTGSFKLEEIKSYSDEYSEYDIIKIIAKGEKLSNHPIAKVILNEVKDIDISDIKDFKEIEGKGISYKLNGKNIKVGSNNFVKTKEKGNIFLSINDELIGSITFNDNVKENAKEIVSELKKENIKTIMLTGDNKSFAKIIALKTEIDDYKCELLPEDKFRELEELKKENKIIFVGDGVNDTPSLVKADVGISMGKIGSNSAIEASDIVIMNDNLEGILNVLKIAKKTNKIININLIFACLTKIIILVLASLGFAHMALAVFADTGVTLITILNSLRILRNNK